MLITRIGAALVAGQSMAFNHSREFRQAVDLAVIRLVNHMYPGRHRFHGGEAVGLVNVVRFSGKSTRSSLTWAMSAARPSYQGEEPRTKWGCRPTRGTAPFDEECAKLLFGESPQRHVPSTEHTRGLAGAPFSRETFQHHVYRVLGEIREIQEGRSTSPVVVSDVVGNIGGHASCCLSWANHDARSLFRARRRMGAPGAVAHTRHVQADGATRKGGIEAP